MALELSTTAELLLEERNVETQIILEIDGFDLIFGAVKVTKVATIGEFTIGDGTLIGGVIVDPNQRDYISLKGTTRNITQQLQQDKGTSGSISSVKIELIDKNGELSSIFQPGAVVSDVLSQRAVVYIAFQGGAHPRDSIRIFEGFIDDVTFGAGNCLLTVAHPEQLKRAELFSLIASNLSSNISDSDTTIPLVSTNGIFESQDVVTTYVRINDELIQVGNINGNDLENCTRGQFGTIAVSHDQDDDVETRYRIQEGMIDLALKLMLSGGDFISDTATRFVQVEPTLSVPNAVFFETFDIESSFGLVNGDLVTISGATNPANNVTDAPILDIQVLPTGSYIVLDGVSLVPETDATATTTFKSQYDTLADGAGLTIRQVDVAQHLSLEALFGNTFHNYDFFLRETIQANDFINQQVYFPSGCFQVPRKARASVSITQPPIADVNSKRLNLDNIKNPDKIKTRRTVSKNFYNHIVWRYDQDQLEDRFKAGVITQSASSLSRIRVPTKSLTIEAQGLRNDQGTNNLIESQSRRFLDRYKFAAEELAIETNYKTGFNIEIGDTVILEGDLGITDITQGNKEFQPRLFEVTNKQLSITTGQTKFKILDTAFGLDGRFGSISPSSPVGIGSTTDSIIINKAVTTPVSQFEKDKWDQYIGEQILVRSNDWAFQENTVIQGFDPANPSKMLIDPPLSTAPLDGYIVDVPIYDESDALVNAFVKRLHCSYTPQVSVLAGISTTVFTVPVADQDKFLVDQYVRVHLPDYSEDADDLQIVDVTGNQVTVDTDMGFVPTSNHLIDRIGFKDEGLAYLLF